MSSSAVAVVMAASLDIGAAKAMLARSNYEISVVTTTYVIVRPEWCYECKLCCEASIAANGKEVR